MQISCSRRECGGRCSHHRGWAALKVAATKDIPAFGGAYLEGATLHVWLTQPTVDGGVRARAALATAVVLENAPGLAVHRVADTFAQLKGWHDAMTGLLALPGVTMMDFDERTNRLMVAVEDTGRDGPAVTAGLARVGTQRPHQDRADVRRGRCPGLEGRERS